MKNFLALWIAKNRLGGSYVKISLEPFERFFRGKNSHGKRFKKVCNLAFASKNQ